MGPIRALFAFAAALVALAPVGVFAQVPAPPPAVTSAGPDNVAVTIYRENDRGGGTLNLGWLTGYALITETRTVRIPAGRSTIRFEGVAGGILPESAIVSGLPDGVLEKNLDADILSPRTLFARSFGRPVVLRRTDDSGRVIEERGIIRSGPDGAAIIQTRDGFIAADCNLGRESLVYDAVPAGLSAKPTLSIETQSPEARDVTITLSYLAWGFDWQANYVATMRPDGKSADLTAWVTLANSDVTSFNNAETMVVAGTVNHDGSERSRVQPTGGALEFKCLSTVVRRVMDVEYFVPGQIETMTADDLNELPQLRAPMAMAMPVAVVAVENLGDLKLFRVPERTTVAAYSVKQVALFAQKTVPVEIVHTANVMQSSRGAIQVATTMRFQNRKADGLGIALPGGSLALFEPAAGSQLLVGEAQMQDYAEGQQVELRVATSTQVSLTRTPPARGKGSVLTASNANPYPVRLEVEFFWPDGKRVSASQRLGTRNGRPLWVVEVPANSTVNLNLGR